MKRPQAVVINETPEGKENLKRILEKDVKDTTGIDFEIISEDNVSNSIRRNSRLLHGAAYFIGEDPSNPRLASQIARTLSERGVKAGKVLTTRRSKPYAETTTAEGYQHFAGWLPKTEGKFDVGEVTRKIQEFREKGKFSQPLKIGIIGLGTLGLGILEKAARSDSISSAHVYTTFVNGNYTPVLDSLDLTGEQREKVTPHGTNLEGVLKANPDVLLITTGQHGINYDHYRKRTELTEMLFKTGLLKIDPILRAIIANNFQGLIAMQSNPNGHFIKHATKRGIPRDQLTSFPPDTIRHRAELYEFLKTLNPKIKEDDVLLRAVGEHMKGGTPLYSEALIRINGGFKPLLDVFPELKDKMLQKEICQRAQSVGLAVVKSASRYQHDYRGVPQRVEECLEDISTFQETPGYPIYSSLLSVPARFAYETSGDGINVRVKRTCTFPNLTKDKGVIRELEGDVRAVIEQTSEWQK